MIIEITFSTVPAWIARRILTLNHAWQNGAQHKYGRPLAAFVVTEKRIIFSLLQHIFRFENLFSLVTAQIIVVNFECSAHCLVSNIFNLFGVMSHFRFVASFIHVFATYLIIILFSISLSFRQKHKHWFGDFGAANIFKQLNNDLFAISAIVALKC